MDNSSNSFITSDKNILYLNIVLVSFIKINDTNTIHITKNEFERAKLKLFSMHFPEEMQVMEFIKIMYENYFL